PAPRSARRSRRRTRAGRTRTTTRNRSRQGRRPGPGSGIGMLREAGAARRVTARHPIRAPSPMDASGEAVRLVCARVPGARRVAIELDRCSPEEQRRAGTMCDLDAAAFVRGRAILRQLAGRVLTMAAEDVPVAVDRTGAV